MRTVRFAAPALLLVSLASCSFEMDTPSSDVHPARYQVTAVEQGALLLDTRTGRTWFTLDGESWGPCAGGPVPASE